MPSSRMRRWLLSTTMFVAACACTKHVPQIQPAQADPVLPTPAKSTAAKGDSASSEDNSPPAGIDLAKLDDFERKVFYRVVNREASACGKGHSLLYSAKHDTSCRASFYAVRYIAHLVDSGFTDSEITEKLEKRFRAPHLPNINLTSSPSKGSPSGRVVVVEFVDYECPHCKHAQALLRQVIEEYPREVKVYFKNYPLSSHANARLAAEASAAANKQGKFWTYSDKVWENADVLTPALLEKIAKEVGLDVARWRIDKDSEEIRARVDEDKSEGNELGINSTPSIYINGRKYCDPLEIVSMRDWINEELGR